MATQNGASPEAPSPAPSGMRKIVVPAIVIGVFLALASLGVYLYLKRYSKPARITRASPVSTSPRLFKNSCFSAGSLTAASSASIAAEMTTPRAP